MRLFLFHYSTIATSPSTTPPTTPTSRSTSRSALPVNKGSEGCAGVVDGLFDIVAVVGTDAVGVTGTTTELAATLAVSVGGW